MERRERGEGRMLRGFFDAQYPNENWVARYAQYELHAGGAPDTTSLTATHPATLERATAVSSLTCIHRPQPLAPPLPALVPVSTSRGPRLHQPWPM